MSLLDTRHKKKSFTLTTLLLSVVLLILFYIGLTYMDPPIENGITVNFGTTSIGNGKVQPKKKIRSEPLNTPPVEPKTQPKANKAVVKEEVFKEAPYEKVITQENEEAIKIKQANELKKKAEEAAKAAQKKKDDAIKKEEAKAAKIAQQKRDAQEKERKEQEAKKKKLDQLMGGLNNSESVASGSQGDDNLAGDKGEPDGDPYATSYYGTPGSGSGTGGYGLNGRSLVSKGKVKQECNQSGRVVVKIIVDQKGNVKSAIPGVKGTTNNSSCLLEPARKTAFMHQWNVDSNAPSEQVGFVVVNFKLGE